MIISQSIVIHNHLDLAMRKARKKKVATWFFFLSQFTLSLLVVIKMSKENVFNSEDPFTIQISNMYSFPTEYKVVKKKKRE